MALPIPNRPPAAGGVGVAPEPADAVQVHVEPALVPVDLALPAAARVVLAHHQRLVAVLLAAGQGDVHVGAPDARLQVGRGGAGRGCREG